MAAAEGAAFGEGGPAASSQGGPTASDQRKKRRLQRHVTLDDALVQNRAKELLEQGIHASLFWNSAFLHRMSAEHRNEFDEHLKWGSKHFAGGSWTWASVCSGSEGAHFVMKAIEDTYPDFQFHQVFACDSKLSVREWIDSVVNSKRTASGQEKMCIF